MIFLGAVVATNIITNAAAAAFLFPVAVSMAASLEVSAMPFVVAMMLGTSYALVNPVGYQTNLMVISLAATRSATSPRWVCRSRCCSVSWCAG